MASKSLNKIIFVDDEEDIRTIVQFALEDIGKYTVKYCSSGYELLKTPESFNPDLILLDMMMPGMGGAETLKELRKIPAFKETPVVFITAKVLTNELDQYRKLGALDVISKPFDPLTLHELLRNIWNSEINSDHP